MLLGATLFWLESNPTANLPRKMNKSADGMPYSPVHWSIRITHPCRNKIATFPMRDVVTSARTMRCKQSLMTNGQDCSDSGMNDSTFDIVLHKCGSSAAPGIPDALWLRQMQCWWRCIICLNKDQRPLLVPGWLGHANESGIAKLLWIVDGNK